MSFNAFGAKIKVIGVGGGGGNAVNTMIKSGLDGVEFIVANTDSQALQASLAHHKVQLGKDLTKGLGAGADPDIGRDAALEDRHEIQELLSDADMVFITAGMGGGTGTGAAAVVAQIARELGALTVAVVTKPFTFEGKRRRKHADMGIARLREAVDTLITIPNQRLLQIATPDLTMLDAFKLADNVLVNAVRGISDIINTPGLINVDFADVKTVMSSMGHALMGIGYGTGSDRALNAAKQAISSPLLEDIDIEGATGILINITAGTSVSIMEVNTACMIIQEAAHEDANIIFGAVIDETLGDEIRITVIATGFPVDENALLETQGGIGLSAPRTGLITSPSYGAPQRNTTPSLTRPFNASRPLTTQPSVSRAVPQAPRASSYQDSAPSHAPTQQPTPQAAVQTFHAPVAPMRSPINEAVVASVSSLPESQPVEPFTEAATLAEWTMQEASVGSSPVTHAEIQTFASPGAPVFPASNESENAEEHFEKMDVVSEEQEEQTVADLVFRETSKSSNETRVGGSAGDGSAFWDFDHTQPEVVTQEIDRKIDEALALASRFSSQPPQKTAAGLDELDDLDLPAFLRHGAAELPRT